MLSGNSRQDGIKVTYVVLLGIMLMFNFKNIASSMSLGLFSVYYKFQLHKI
jgi:hypothetical protein